MGGEFKVRWVVSSKCVGGGGGAQEFKVCGEGGDFFYNKPRSSKSIVKAIKHFFQFISVKL